MPDFRAPRGTRDLLPADRALFDRLIRTGAELAARYGYRPIETPLFEQTAVFERGIGEVTDVVEKELFRIAPRTEESESWALRPEPTAGIVRAYLQHGMQTLPQPVKLTATGPMFRYDRPQAGRYRQFWQFDVEAIGDAGPAIDAEIIELGHRFYAEVGVEGVEVLVNSIGDATCRPAYIEELTGYYRGHLAACRRPSATGSSATPLRLLDSKDPAMTELNAAAPRITDRLCEACAAHFEAVQAHLTRSACLPRSSPRLVRGLDYYTRTAFEFYVAGREGQQQALGGGGRYDGLVELLGGRPTPGIGFGLGLDRVAARARGEQGAGRARRAGPGRRGRRRRSRGHLARLGSPRSCGPPGSRARAELSRRKLGKQLEAAAQGRGPLRGDHRRRAGGRARSSSATSPRAPRERPARGPRSRGRPCRGRATSTADLGLRHAGPRLQRLVELDHREQVAVRILEPRGAPGADRRDPAVDRPGVSYVSNVIHPASRRASATSASMSGTVNAIWVWRAGGRHRPTARDREHGPVAGVDRYRAGPDRARPEPEDLLVEGPQARRRRCVGRVVWHASIGQHPGLGTESDNSVDYDTPAMTDTRPSLATPYRTHTCGAAARVRRRASTARLAGWVHRRRDHGQLIFLDLRDRHGITQVVIDKADAPDAHAVAEPGAQRVRRQRSTGEVAPRLPGTENPKLPTGAIELRRADVRILSRGEDAAVLHQRPDAPIDEALRLKYRYLDLRREAMAAPAAPAQPRWSRRSARSTTRTASSRSRRRPDQVHARGRARLHRPVAPPAGQRLRAAAEPAAAQAAADGRRHRPLLPDRPLLPRRGPARRPPARVHPARPRDELRRRGDA